jgi:hypothetical protein
VLGFEDFYAGRYLKITQIFVKIENDNCQWNFLWELRNVHTWFI